MWEPDDCIQLSLISFVRYLQEMEGRVHLAHCIVHDIVLSSDLWSVALPLTMYPRPTGRTSLASVSPSLYKVRIITVIIFQER